jgi:hypothetical protein
MTWIYAVLQIIPGSKRLGGSFSRDGYDNPASACKRVAASLALCVPLMRERRIDHDVALINKTPSERALLFF